MQLHQGFYPQCQTTRTGRRATVNLKPAFHVYERQVVQSPVLTMVYSKIAVTLGSSNYISVFMLQDKTILNIFIFSHSWTPHPM